MKCQYYDGETPQEMNSYCECDDEINSKSENLDSLATSADSEQLVESKENNDGCLKKILGIVFWVVVIVIAYNKWLIPSVVPENLWDESIRREVHNEVAQRVGDNAFTVAYDKHTIECEKFEKNNEFSDLILENLIGEDTDKLYHYTIESSWNIYEEGEYITTVDAKTDIFCKPKIFSEYKYFKWTECYPNDIFDSTDNIITESIFEESITQEEFEKSITIDEFVLVNDEHGITGKSLAIYLNWTNNTGKPTSPFSEFVVKMYQNGIELETDYNNLSEFNTMREVLPNSSVSFSKAFELMDLMTPVDVVITTFSGDVFYDESEPKITRKVNISKEY